MALQSPSVRVWIPILCLLLASCSTTIGNPPITRFTFEPGKTTKSDVARTLGLPAAMRTDEKSGLELWAYQESPELTGVHVPVVTPTGGGAYEVSMNHVSITQRQGDVFAGASVVCAFNREGVLTQVVRRNAKGKSE